MSRQPLLVYFGHHKCASSWITAIIRQLCRVMNLTYTEVFNSESFNGSPSTFVQENNLDFLAYTNANIAYASELGDYVGFHIIRDPRDILVSAYFSHLHSHSTRYWPELIPHRERLKAVSKEEGLLLEMEFCRQFFEDITCWDYAQPNVLELKMEQMIQSPYETLVDAFTSLELICEKDSIRTRLPALLSEANYKLHKATKHRFPFLFAAKKIPARDLMGIVYQNRFSVKASGRKQGEEDAGSHYRKGAPGDWMNHFSPGVRDAFKQQYNELLLKLGYEESPNW